MLQLQLRVRQAMLENNTEPNSERYAQERRKMKNAWKKRGVEGALEY